MDRWKQGRSVGPDTKCKDLLGMQRKRRRKMEILNNTEITEHFQRLKLSNSITIFSSLLSSFSLAFVI